jgi:hypothetical protein
MVRTFAILGLALLGMSAAPRPAAAFWERSQWLACSEAVTAEDYQRRRCWELDGYAGTIAPAFGGTGLGGKMPPQGRPSPRRGGPVSRLG